MKMKERNEERNEKQLKSVTFQQPINDRYFFKDNFLSFELFLYLLCL